MSDRSSELFDSIKQNPNDEAAIESLELDLTESSDWSGLVDLYVHLGQHSSDPTKQSHFMRKAAKLAEVEFDDAVRAVEFLNSSLDGDDDGQIETLGEMRRLLRHIEDWDNFLEVASMELELEDVPGRRAQVLLDIGQAFESNIGDHEQAIECYQAAFEADSECLEALWSARRLYRQHEDWDMVAQLFQIEMELTTDDGRRADVLRELGMVYLHDLNDQEQADLCFAEVLEIRPDDEAIRALISPGAVDEGRLDASDASTDIDDESVSDEQDVQLDLVSSTAVDTDDVVDAIVDAAEEPDAADAQSENADEPALAVDESGRHDGDENEDSPHEDAQGTEGLSTAAESDMAVDDSALSEAAEPQAASESTTDDVPDAPELLPVENAETPEENIARLAELEALAAELEDFERFEVLLEAIPLAGRVDASRLYVEAAKAQPAEVSLHWRVGQHLSLGESHASTVASALESLAESDEQGFSTHFKAHRLVFGAAHLDEGRTVDFKLRDLAKKEDANQVEPWQIQQLIQSNKWRNIQQILTAQHGGDPNESRLYALREMARLATERASDSGKAMDFWRQVHQMDKADVDARQALLVAYKAASKWKEYAEVLRLEVDSVSEHDVDAKLQGLRELVATISAHLRQDAQVIQLYGQILELSPGDPDAIEALAEKYEKMRRWPDLIGLLQQQAESAHDDDERMTIALRIAGVYLNNMRNQMEATNAYESVLAQYPDSLDALQALDGLYEKRRDWDNLVSIRIRLADRLTDADERLAAYVQLAEYADKKIRRPELSQSLWERVLEQNADSVDAMRALVTIYEQAKEWDALVDGIDMLVERVEGEKEKVDLLLKAGTVLQDRLQDADRASHIWRRILDVDPENRRAGDNYKKVLTTLGEWDDLESFYGASDRWGELVRILESQVGTQKDPDVQLNLLFRSARIYSEQLAKEDRAVRALERIRQIDSANVEAALTLEPIYEAHGDYRKLAMILEVLAESVDDQDQRLSYLGRLAKIYEEHLRNPMAAFDWLRQALELGGIDSNTRSELRRLGALTNQWGTVHDSLADIVDQVDDVDERTEILLALGSILDEHLNSVDESLARYNEALSLDETNSVALDAVEQLYTRGSQWYELLGILQQKINLAEDDEAQASLLVKQAVIHEEHLADLQSAVECYVRLTELQGDEPDTLMSLRRLYEALEQFESLREILEKQLAHCRTNQDVKEEISVRLALADVLLEHLADADAALNHIEAILEAQPEHGESRRVLEALIGDDALSVRVALLLEPIYEANDEWHSVINTLTVRLEAAEDTDARCTLLRRIAWVHHTHTLDAALAFEAYAQLLREAPNEVETLNTLVELAESTQRWQELAELLEDIVSAIDDPTLATVMLRRLAEGYEVALDNQAMAVDAHRRILELNDEDRASVDALERLFSRGEDWTELLEIYRRKLEWTEEGVERRDLQFKIAQLLEDLLNDAHGAIAVYIEVLESNEGDEDALRALARLYQAETMWVELADIVERQAEQETDDASRLDILYRLGEIKDVRLGESEQGLEVYRSILERDPSHEAARNAIERLLDDPDLRSSAADTLEPIYEGRNNWDQLISALEIQCESSEDETQKVALLHRIAGLQLEKLGAPEKAFGTYARAFRRVPEDTSTLAQLDNLAESLSLWSELAQVFRGHVSQIGDVATATDIHIRLAHILNERLGEVEEARDNFEAALQNDETAIPVIESLESIYEKTAQWESLVALLIRKVELVDEVEVQKNLLFKTAALFEEMIEDPLRAIETYRMIGEIDSSDRRVVESLERLFLSLEHWQDYLDILQQKVELTEDVEQKKSIMDTIGQTYQRELGDHVGAVETYQAILELDEGDLGAMRQLDQLFEFLEQWDDQLNLLNMQVAYIDGQEAALNLKFRIARLQEQQIGDQESAVQGYRAILETSSAHEQARHALEAMVREDREAADALAVLEKVLSQDLEWTRLVGVWNDYLTVADDLEARSRVRMLIAQTYDEHLVDAEGAFSAYGEALKEDPTNEDAINALEAIARRIDAWSSFVELVEAQVDLIPSEYVARDFYLRIARVFDEELRSGGDAIDRYRRVLEIDPEHDDTILALDRLYQQEGRWPDLADILQLRIERTEPEEQIELLMRLGNLNESALENVEAAIASYSDVLSIESGYAEAIEALRRMFAAGHEQIQIGEILEPIYISQGEYQRLHDLLEALLQNVSPGVDRGQAIHRLARISLDDLNDSEGALNWFGQAFQEDSSDEEARAEIRRIAEANMAFEKQVAIYSNALEQTADTEITRSICLELAALYRERLRNDDSAEQLHAFVLSDIDAGDVTALSGLVTLYEEQARWDEHAQRLAQLVDVTYDEDERSTLTAKLGRVYEEKLADIESAVTRYCAVLDVDPYNGDTLDRLARIYTAQEAWPLLFEIHERQKENAKEDGRKAELAAAMANLASNYLARPDDAIDLWNEVLECRGEDMHALQALEFLYEQQEAWRELVDVCDRQVNAIEDDVDSALRLYSKLGRVWGDHLDRERNAIENWNQVLALDPQQLDALWALQDLYDRASDPAQLANTIEALLGLLDEQHEQRLELYRQIARLYQEALEDVPKAIDAWRNVLAWASTDAEAIDNLEELFTGSEDWASCVTILEIKASQTEDNYDRVSILFRVAEMYAENLDDTIGSRGAYESILSVQPDNIDAYEQLLALYEEGERWDELVGLLLNRLEFTDDTYEQVELYQRTAEIFETKLGSGENAFVVLSQAFEATLDDERFGADLARLASENDAWGALIETYQKVIQAVGPTLDSIPMRLRVAEWWSTKAGESQNAAGHYQEILRIEPDNLQALTALEALFEQYEGWDDAVRILERKVELTHDPDERKASYEKMARLLETKLNRGDDAIEAYRQAMLIDMSDRVVLDALERLYTVRMRWEELIEILTQQAVILTQDAEVVEKYLQIGELWESRLNSPDRAIDAYRQALSLDENCLDAMRALEHLYTQQERWYETLDIYDMMNAVLSEPQRRVEVLNRQGTLQVQQLQDIGGAIDTYRRVLGIQPESADAVEALEVLYRREERWEELADVYELHLNAVEDTQYRIAIRGLIGELYQVHLGNHERAIESLLPILDDEPMHVATLSTLAELYQELESWNDCIGMLTRLAESTPNVAQKPELFSRVGAIYREQLDHAAEAETWYRRALDVDLNYLPALLGLKDVYVAQGEWQEAVRILQMMEAAAKSLEDKSRHLYAIGQIHRANIDDQTMAIDYFEQAIDNWPENVDAAAALIDVYWEDKNWPRAEPLLTLLLEQTDRNNGKQLHALYYRSGVCAEHLQKVDQALKAYRQAYELDSTHLPTLKNMGGLLMQREEWDRAFKIFQTLLVHHRDHLEEAEISQIFFRQGSIKLEVNEKRKALDFFRKSLDVQPGNVDALHAVAAVHEARGEWDDVVHYRRRLVDHMEPGADRFELLVSIGEVLGERLGNHRGAVEVLEVALAEEPGSRLVLGKLLGFHEASGNWHAAVETLTQLADLEENGTRKAKYWCGVATIQQKYLDDRFMAVRSFDNALDADPSMLRAFQAIDQLLTEDKDYERQDRYYRKMLKRATDHHLDAGLVFKLAKNLGEINRSRLQRYTEAIKAYRIALTRKPEDISTHNILAQLYELEDDASAAIKQYYTLIRLEPTNIECYRSLKRLFLENDRIDEAWCVCQVLCFLNKASQEERVFFEKHRSRTLQQSQKALEPKHWALIGHPMKSPLLDQLIQRLNPYTAQVMSQSHKELGINRKRAVINQSEQTPFNSVLAYVARTMRFGVPECFADPSNRPGVSVVNLSPPALVVGNDVIRGARMQELAFMNAKQLMLMLPQHMLSTIDPTYERRKARILGTAYTLMKLVNPAANAQFDEELLDILARSIPQSDLTEFNKLIAKMSTDPNSHLNVSNWLEGLEHSTNRLGLLLCNDLVSAASVLKNEAGDFSRASVKDRVRELVVFAISDEYFQLRKALGLSVGHQG